MCFWEDPSLRPQTYAYWNEGRLGSPKLVRGWAQDGSGWGPRFLCPRL